VRRLVEPGRNRILKRIIVARKSTSGQPAEPARDPDDVPEDVDVAPAADEPADAAAEPAEAAADEVVDDAAAEPETEEAEDAVDEADAKAEDDAEPGLADKLFDLDADGSDSDMSDEADDTDTSDEEDDGKVRQPVRKLTKAPVKKAQTSNKRATSTAPTSTGRTTPWGFVRQAIGELRKVVWPSGDVVGQYFVVVLVFVLFIMFYVFGLTTLFGWVLTQIFR